MKKIIYVLVFTTLVIAVNASDNCKKQGCSVASTATLKPEDIDATLLAQLKQLYEDEKLALMVYTSFLKKYDLQIFSNISQSEKNHRQSVENLLKNIPEAAQILNAKDKVFLLPENQNTYSGFIKEGEKDILSALKVGALIEDMDIYHLNGIINSTKNETILAVCKNLKAASENHMRAFNRHLNWRGSSYTPQYISEDELHAILSSENSCHKK